MSVPEGINLKNNFTHNDIKIKLQSTKVKRQSFKGQQQSERFPINDEIQVNRRLFINHSGFKKTMFTIA